MSESPRPALPGTPLPLEDLPAYTPWPARLLGVDSFAQRHRTPEDAVREYETEKWGVMLGRARAQGAGLPDVDRWELGDGPHPAAFGDELRLLDTPAMRRAHVDVLEAELGPWLPAPALVELGAGFGAVLLPLAARLAAPGMRVMGGEFAPSGRDLLDLLAAAERLEVASGWCDFLDPKVSDLDVPDGAVVFTSFAVCSVPSVPSAFIAAVSGWRPKVVVHVEPCYEHCDPATLIGLLRRRYIEVNDYNRDLASVIGEAARQGAIDVVAEKRCVFGGNALLCGSVIAWKPRR